MSQNPVLIDLLATEIGEISGDSESEDEVNANESNETILTQPDVVSFCAADEKRSVAKVNWFYTFNNYSEEDRDKLIKLLEVEAKHHVCGREIAPTTGTPHLQGVFALNKKLRWKQVVKLLGNRKISVRACRVYPAAVKYCKKEGDFVETGTEPSTKGGDNWGPFKAAVKSGDYTLKELREKFSAEFVRGYRFCLDYIEDHRKRPEVVPLPGPLYPWQQAIKDYIDGPVNNREIVFVVDFVGNSGKSEFCIWCCDSDEQELTQIIEMGLKKDMLYDFNDYEPDQYPGTLFVDCVRSGTKHMDYGVLEKIKGGRFTSHKYKNKRVRMMSPHMIVMMNEMPCLAALSVDRYKVMVIDRAAANGFYWMSEEDIINGHCNAKLLESWRN